MKADASTATIALVDRVCAELAAERVGYCHFKSNAFLDRSRTGENDLDLLIARGDADRFAAIMHRLGFKLALRRQGLPGVLDYYGLDPEVGRVVHVHAHYQLVVGDDLTKNYRLPLESAFLTSVRKDGEFLIPEPELEYILLVIRLVLKHCTWDAFLTRRASIREGDRAELEFLEARIDRDRIGPLLERSLPLVDSQTLAACRRALDAGAAIGVRISAGTRLTTALRPCARRARAVDISLKVWRRGIEIGRRVIRRPAPRKRLAGGGALIAIIGADGAGKSTAVDALASRLAKNFAVTRAHLGKPPPSLVTRSLRNLARARSAALKLAARLGARRSPSRSTEQALIATAIARDRYRAYRRIRRIATNGDIIVCDRFPVPQLTLMDAPRVERVGPGRRPSLIRRLAAREKRYYRAIGDPDILIVLRVDPEIAVQRRPEDPADFVRERWSEIWAIDWASVPAQVIDASQPRDDVVAEVEALVWSRL
jgi:thymidylate kinase